MNRNNSWSNVYLLLTTGHMQNQQRQSFRTAEQLTEVFNHIPDCKMNELHFLTDSSNGLRGVVGRMLTLQAKESFASLTAEKKSTIVELVLSKGYALASVSYEYKRELWKKEALSGTVILIDS